MVINIIKWNLICLCLFINATNSSILLLTNKDIQIPALGNFNDNDFKNVVKQLGEPKVVTFNSNFLISAKTVIEILGNQSSSYIPNAKIFIPDYVQDLTGENEVDHITIKKALKNVENENVLVVLNIQENERIKRKIEDVSSTSTMISITELPETPYEKPSGGPVLYSASSESDKNMEAMIFSSKPPLLKVNGTSIFLGDATFSKVDVRDTYTRLIATIPVENGKITLRFKFQWQGGYWYLNYIEGEFVGNDAKQFNLTLKQEVSAPASFSYHCGGHVLFTDPENDIELYLFEIQAQPDAYTHRFGDAYNCVPFTTVPIWSGLFVSFILSIGLGVGLFALNSIKTMDKFDNHKTKMLTITVWE